MDRNNMDGRRGAWDYSALKNKIIGQQFLPENRIAHSDANTTTREELKCGNLLFRATHGLTRGTSPQRSATKTLPKSKGRTTLNGNRSDIGNNSKTLSTTPA